MPPPVNPFRFAVRRRPRGGGNHESTCRWMPGVRNDARCACRRAGLGRSPGNVGSGSLWSSLPSRVPVAGLFRPCVFAGLAGWFVVTQVSPVGGGGAARLGDGSPYLAGAGTVTGTPFALIVGGTHRPIASLMFNRYSGWMCSGGISSRYCQHSRSSGNGSAAWS